MSQGQNPHRSTAVITRDIPIRQAWNTSDILCMGDDYTYADAAKEITLLWKEWADSVELNLHGMIKQMEELNISYDDYLNLVRQLVTYPARPAADHQILSNELLSDLWSRWADVVEKIAVDMRRAIERSVPLPREEQVLSVGEPMDFSLDLSNQEPPPMHMAAHLRKMLWDGTVAREELADYMEVLDLQEWHVTMVE